MLSLYGLGLHFILAHWARTKPSSMSTEEIKNRLFGDEKRTLSVTHMCEVAMANRHYLDSSQTTNTCDNLARLSQMNDSIGTSSFSYDADGTITGFTDAEGFTLV